MVGGVAVVIVLIVGAVALFGGDDGGGSASSLDDVQAATVQILTEGTFEDPAAGAVANAGAGTGFIIDESGIAVTNNHVVTGAASVQVKVGGDDEELDAEILGVSECSDLAVIDIEGDGFPALEWSEVDPGVGTQVWVAGFPLGDPEYTLTDGTISKAEAAVDTPWASVEGALETTAKINPGNSGGPLVDESGRVVGVNYASNPETDQNLSIKASLAQDVVEVLREGDDQEALGMNTEAIVDEEGTGLGVWVAAVAAGSPASEAGIEPGDVITEMNGQAVGDDGTMGDYCDIISTAGTEGAIGVTVVRTSTGETLEGEINGTPIEGSGGGTTGGGTSGETTAVSSDGGDVTADVPVEWEVETGPEGFNAAPALSEFNSSFGAPGVSVRIVPGEGSPEAVIADFLASVGGDNCEVTSSDPFDNGVYAGIEQIQQCGSAEIAITAGTSGSGNTVLALLQGSSQADLDAGLAVILSIRE